MPVETFKERIVQATNLFPSDILYGINRDNETTEGREMPPLNTDDGLVWIRDKIKKYKPDLIVFDSIMCLLSGDMKDEETWEPVKILMKEMSNQRIAQIWIHHTGHDAGRSYGTSTREWELDTVLKLERPPSNEAGFITEFTKARLRTPTNEAEFNRIHCTLTDEGWTSDVSVKEKAKKGDDRTNYARYILQAYDDLAFNVRETPVGHNGANVKAVKSEVIRRWIINHGLIAPKDDGAIVMAENDRKIVNRAQGDLIKVGRIAANSSHIWRINPL
jgi:hypothetical protein